MSESWRDRINAARRPAPTRVSTNGQVVLPARVRREVGIESGDLVVSVPVGPGVLLVEKVAPAASGAEPENPLRGVWGRDPDRWLDRLRSGWRPARS